MTSVQNMKRLHIILIGIIFISFSVMASANTGSEESFTDEMEAEFLEWINSARANPLEMAATVGLDPDQVLEDFPEFYDDLTQGMDPLNPDAALRDVARAHTEDMFTNGFFGYDSSDGTDLETRIRESAYNPESTGEAIGMLGFFNYIDTSEAVYQIFARLYIDELNPDRTRPLNILNPDFEDIGIGFGAGEFTVKEIPYNAYLVTCDFAYQVSMDDQELYLVELINQFRASPLDMVEAYGIDIEPYFEADTNLYEVLSTPVAPLVPNESLQSASKGHSDDMLVNNFIDHISSDGRSTEDRMVENDYDPIDVGEVLQRVELLPFTEAAYALHRVMEQMLLDEITNYVDFGTSTLLNPDFQDLGIGMVSGTCEFDDETVDVLISTTTLGTEEKERPPYLVGTVYSDDDENGLYSYREGISGIRVTVEWDHSISGFLEIKELWTNKAGGFQCPLDSGLHRVTVYVPEMEPVEYFLTTGEESVRLEYCLPENPDNVESVENGS